LAGHFLDLTEGVAQANQFRERAGLPRGREAIEAIAFPAHDEAL
jgi:hypothetical protein